MADENTQVDDALSPSIREAALAAMEAAGVPTAGEWDTEDEQSTDQALEDQTPQDDPASSDEAVTGDQEPENTDTPPASEDDEVPTEYFGLDLSDLPSEKRQEIIDRFKEQDSYIQSIQRAKAEEDRKNQQPPEAEVEPEMPSDDEIMEMLGYDPEDPMYDVKKEVALPMAKMVLNQTAIVQQMAEERQIAEFEAHWDSTLDALEATHGKLPISRDELIDIAIENNIFDPADAYARVYLQGRAAVSKDVEAFKAEAAKIAADKAKPKPPSTTRPRSATTEPTAPSENLTPREAAIKAAKDMGLDWKDTLSSVT